MNTLDNVLKSTWRLKRFYAEEVLGVSPSAFSKMLNGYQTFNFRQQRKLERFLIEQEQIPEEKVRSAFSDFNDSRKKRKGWVAIRP